MLGWFLTTPWLESAEHICSEYRQGLLTSCYRTCLLGSLVSQTVFHYIWAICNSLIHLAFSIRDGISICKTTYKLLCWSPTSQYWYIEDSIFTKIIKVKQCDMGRSLEKSHRRGQWFLLSVYSLILRTGHARTQGIVICKSGGEPWSKPDLRVGFPAATTSTSSKLTLFKSLFKLDYSAFVMAGPTVVIVNSVRTCPLRRKPWLRNCIHWPVGIYWDERILIINRGRRVHSTVPG